MCLSVAGLQGSEQKRLSQHPHFSHRSVTFHPGLTSRIEASDFTQGPISHIEPLSSIPNFLFRRNRVDIFQVESHHPAVPERGVARHDHRGRCAGTSICSSNAGNTSGISRSSCRSRSGPSARSPRLFSRVRCNGCRRRPSMPDRWASSTSTALSPVSRSSRPIPCRETTVRRPL